MGNIGAIFEQGTDEIQSAFKFAMLNHNLNVSSRRFELQAYVDVINTADAFKLSRLICNQFSRGVFAMLGAVSPDSFDTLHSYSNTFQMPFVTPWFPEKVLQPSSGALDFAISMRPDYYQAIIDTVRYYGWDRIIYMYDSHDVKLYVMDLSGAKEKQTLVAGATRPVWGISFLSGPSHFANMSHRSKRNS
ncbi:hypothetical protein pipiens_004185 [Culex pipiens pipiens]|uniref:Receptor ligand binding region domain-containing protein n=1 Tax=Culex pipiens pipiens TaxID=38569 RepID=A0ABD1CLZ1_CULPP